TAVMEPGRRSPKRRNSSRSLDLWGCQVARWSDIKGLLSVAHLVCTYISVQNHGTKKGNPLDAPSMSPARHEYVACQARKAGISFTKEGNCFTHISDAAGLTKIADTLSEARAIGRLSQVCERWIYTTCLCFALDLEEQERSRFQYQYSNYQIEYSRNLVFEVGGHMDQVFQALIDRSRAPPGHKDHQNHPRTPASSEIPQTEKEGGRVGSSARETCV